MMIMREIDERMEKVLARIPKEWGKYISCDEGWWPLIADLDDKLAEIDPHYIVHQCKEKFGGLRYYFETSLPYGEDDYNRMTDLVKEAEEASYKTCENCGNEGELRSGGYWVKTVCSNCVETVEKFAKFKSAKNN